MREKTTIEETGMPRFALDIYPTGKEYRNQRGPGIPIDRGVAETLDIFALSIIDDMQFLGLYSGGLGAVRMGKSTLAQHHGKYFTEKVNEHLENIGRGKEKIDFGIKNIVLGDLEEVEKRARELPKYSVLIIDEGDSVNVHPQSQEMRKLKTFLQKSGQYNLFIMIILPSFFDFPKNIATDRSNYLCVVKFKHDHSKRKFFQRGYYDFYNPHAKNLLFQLGKKLNNVNAQKPTLSNCWFHGDYLIPEKEYREMKSDDMVNAKNHYEKRTQEVDLKKKILAPIIEKLLADGKSIKEIADLTGNSRQTLYNLGFSREYASTRQVSKYNNNSSDNLDLLEADPSQGGDFDN